MAEFQVYRIRIFSSQLFDLIGTRSEILKGAIVEKPSISPNSANRLKNNKWHIGNIIFIEENVLAFALGRQSPSTGSRYDEETKNFYSSIDDEAPFSIVIIDVLLGIVAIMVKPDVGSTDVIAQRLITLLTQTKVFTDSLAANIVIDPIYDSKLFISILRESYQIKRFIFEFFPPNPDDAEIDIQVPAERWAQRANASHGRVSIDGSNLDITALEPVAQGVISTGSEVIAVVRERASSRRTRRVSSKTQRVATDVDRVSLENREGLREAYRSVIEIYRSNRGIVDEN